MTNDDLRQLQEAYPQARLRLLAPTEGLDVWGEDDNPNAAEFRAWTEIERHQFAMESAYLQLLVS